MTTILFVFFWLVFGVVLLARAGVALFNFLERFDAREREMVYQGRIVRRVRIPEPLQLEQPFQVRPHYCGQPAAWL